VNVRSAGPFEARSKNVSPDAGKPADQFPLVDVPRLITAYYTEAPDPSVPTQRVAFGTSGHRGSSLKRSFNEQHILAISQAICLYRKEKKIDGPLFLGMDTHALSVPACATALEVLAANGVEVMIAEGDEYTPTPVISHAILTYNRGRKTGLADGVVITPSHNPPHDGGLKYNPPSGGPADNAVTDWIEAQANALLEARPKGVKRIPHEQALRASTTHRHDYLNVYINDLGNVIDLDVVRGVNLRLGVDPLGGAGVRYWARIAERHGLNLTVVNDAVDPTFRFMTVDWDGQIRMDPSSPYAMERLIGLKDRFDLSFACDTDHDRHGIVTKSAGLLPPNHFLAVAISQLFPNRPNWRTGAAVGKTVVSSAMIDRVTAKLRRNLFEVPVGFKWFVDGLLDGSLGFGGEESAGATFVRLDGRVWTTDKDGFVPCLLAAEITARTGRDPGELYRELTHEFGEPVYDRVQAPATPEQKELLSKLSPQQVKLSELAGEKIQIVLTRAPGNSALIGGLKVIAKSGWFAARPSGTEDIYKIYAESFRGADHLRRIVEEARTIVSGALAPSPVPKRGKGRPSSGRHQMTVEEAVEVWRNEGDPN
jgi:phosphoglucomutase